MEIAIKQRSDGSVSSAASIANAPACHGDCNRNPTNISVIVSLRLSSAQAIWKKKFIATWLSGHRFFTIPYNDATHRNDRSHIRL